MPGSAVACKIQIVDWVRSRVPKDGLVLDVGAGCGTYSWLLPEYRMDAVEIWEPYVVKYNLHHKYRRVFVTDALSYLRVCQPYRLIILGDVLEHLSVADSQELLRLCFDRSPEGVASLPLMMSQGEYEGNPYEIHKQDDLTLEVIKSRYPSLELLHQEQGISAWYWSRWDK